MQFELYTEDQVFVEQHMAVIQQKLTTALMLLLQQLHDDERKRTGFVGKGISGDAARETASAHEKLQQEHEKAFGSPDEQRKRVQEMQENLARNTMVREK